MIKPDHVAFAGSSYNGMDLRTYIAAAALPAIITAHVATQMCMPEAAEGYASLPRSHDAAEMAVNYADALLARLNS